MVEKSGIDLLNELIDQVKLLNKRFEITEQNVKMLLARSNEQPVKQSTQVLANHAPATIKPAVSAPSLPQPETVRRKEVSKNSTRVIGKVKDGGGRVLSGVNIKIYDASNTIIKHTKTNRAGDWMCLLEPGQYAASYFLEGQVDGNTTFNVSSNEKIVRVAQPSF